MIVYQLHIGTYPLAKAGPYATFLDIIDKIAYLAALGVNVLQPLPIDEVETTFSLGYSSVCRYCHPSQWCRRIRA
jgi:1,4-alpha-glucan branching enzyme